MSSNNTMKHPKALHLLNFVCMWEYFSYYGVRALLVLFLVQGLSYNDSSAFGLYALYTTLVDLGGVVGGIIADRYLGLKRSIHLGGWIMFLGYVCLAVPNAPPIFFLGLGLIVMGTGLFRSNTAVLIGQFYEENDSRREAGFTLYYTGINMALFVTTLLCGFVAVLYGWHAGFGLAALGVFVGNIALLYGRKLLEGKGEMVLERRKTIRLMEIISVPIVVPFLALAIYNFKFVIPFVPFIALAGIYYVFKQTKSFSAQEKKRLYLLGLYVVCLIIFYGFEEQLGSSLTIFSERHVDRETWLGAIPAATLITFNPLTILITGPLLSRFVQRFHMNGMSMIAISFFFLGAAYWILSTGCMDTNSISSVPVGYVTASFVLIALGELCIGPTIYAYASEIAPRKFQGLVMGIVTMGFSMANLLSGWISQSMAAVEGQLNLDVYSGSFNMIGVCAISIGCALLCIRHRRSVLSACLFPLKFLSGQIEAILRVRSQPVSLILPIRQEVSAAFTPFLTASNAYVEET